MWGGCDVSACEQLTVKSVKFELRNFFCESKAAEFKLLSCLDRIKSDEDYGLGDALLMSCL